MLAAAVVLGISLPAIEATAGESVIERWTCTPEGLGSLFCSDSFNPDPDDPDCRKVTLTGNMGDGTGTIQVTGMPMEKTHFKATQFERGWIWPFNDPKHAFGIGYSGRTGFYISQIEGAKAEDAGIFHCRREVG